MLIISKPTSSQGQLTATHSVSKAKISISAKSKNVIAMKPDVGFLGGAVIFGSI